MTLATVVSRDPMTEFTINAIPVAQPRQRHTIIAGHVSNYTPKDSPVNAYKAMCRIEAVKHFTAPLAGPVQLWLTFVMPRPASMTTKKGPNARSWCVGKNDLDNLYKSTTDALQGICYHNDSQIAWACVQKIVAAAYEKPRVIVRLYECQGPARQPAAYQ